MSIPKQPLPPLPTPPKRSLSPPAQRALTHPVDTDAETPTKNVDVSEYSSLLSIFDPLSHRERYELIELGRLYVELGPHERRVAIVALRRLAGQK